MISYALFFNPIDRPGKYVLRKFRDTTPLNARLFSDREEVQDFMEKHHDDLVWLERTEADDECMIGCWI